MAIKSKCRSCGFPIWWATLPSGKLSPFDVEPVHEGGFHLEGDPLRATPVAPLLRRGKKGWVSHFATCPHAGDWRKER